MRFNPDLRELIPPSHLDAQFGGDFAYEFEPQSYWDQIVTYDYFSDCWSYHPLMTFISAHAKLRPTELGSQATTLRPLLVPTLKRQGHTLYCKHFCDVICDSSLN